MAHTLAVGDIVQAKFYCSDFDQQAINVLHYRVSGLTAPGPTDADAAIALSTQAATVYRAYLTINSTYRGCRVQVIKPTIQPAQISTASNGLGSVVDDVLPTQVAFLLSPRTAVAGRSGRGRCYLPFWPEGDNTTVGVPSAGAITRATAWSAAMYASLGVTVGLNTATLTPVIYHRNAVPWYDDVTSVVIRVKWATQRRRSQINRPDVFGPTP